MAQREHKLGGIGNEQKATEEIQSLADKVWIIFVIHLLASLPQA